VKLIRFALISVLLLFAVVLAISLFIPSHIRVSRAVNLRPGSTFILGDINDLAKWKNWYPGFDTMSVEPLVKEDDRVLSAKIQHATTVTLITHDSNEVKAEFNSGNKTAVVGGWKMLSYSQSDSLTLQWYYDFHVRWYPWEKFFSLAYDKMYGTQMETGLGNLKRMAER
jgi:hypothetical protein